ncbi:MAG: hypothetical protein ABIQ79_08150 [Nitrospiraceae bacterium]
MGGMSTLQIKFFLLKHSNKSLDQGDALPRLLRAVHEQSVVPMLLEFRGFLAKRAADALAELHLCSRPSCVEIGEAFSAKVSHLCKKLLELSRATSTLFNRGSFRPHAGWF